MNLVYGSSSSSFMDCMVFFGDECFIFSLSGVRLDSAPASAPTSFNLSSLEDTSTVPPPAG